jgi:hypothetical protein
LERRPCRCQLILDLWRSGEGVHARAKVRRMSSDLLDDAAARAQRYLAGLDHRPVAPTPEAVAALAAWDEPMPSNRRNPSGCSCSIEWDRRPPWQWRAAVFSAS